MIRKLAMAMVVSGALGSSYANALGLGEIKLNSSLNQPLDAQVKLLSVGDLSENEILPNLASHEDFARAGVERVFFLTGIKFDVVLDGEGGAVLHLTTDRIVREPFLNFLIELHWPSGRLLREYTALLDPPLFSQAAPAPIQQSTTVTPVIQPAARQEVAPQRPAYNAASVAPSSKQATSAPASFEKKDGTVRVKKNDTLWGIAHKNRPDTSVTVRQTMVAIQQHNPQAFINNNINLLKTGQVLRIPEVEEIRRVSSREARAEMQRQMDEWQGKKTIDATQAYSSPDEAGTTSQPAGSVKLVATQNEVDTNEAAGAGVDTNQGGGFGEGSSISGQAEGAGNVTIDDVEALQKQLDDLQRLMSLKQEQLALLQATRVEQDAQAAAEKASAEQGSQAGQEVTGGAVITSGDAEEELAATINAEQEGAAGGVSLPANGSPAGVVDAQQETAQAGADGAQVTDDTSSDKDLVAAAKPAVPQPQQQEGIMSILFNNPLYIGVLLVVILGGLILLGTISRRRKEEQEQPEVFEENVALADSNIDLPGEEQVDTNEEVVSNLAEAEPLVGAGDLPEDSADEARKLIDEADIFIAYGRYERAIEILQPAVNDNPQNTELRLKLAETYLLNRDEARFTQQEADIQAIGNAAAIAAVEELKEKYAALSDSDSREETAQQEVIDELDFASKETADSVPDEAVAEEDFLSFDMDEIADDEAAAESTGQNTAAVELDDFEFNLPEDTTDSIDDAAEDEPVAHDNLVDFDIDSVEEAEDNGLDFNLDEKVDEDEQVQATNADDLDFLIDTDESATKLELAKAYIDMADTEAAQEILNEVVSEGSDAQQQEARQLLENLA